MKRKYLIIGGMAGGISAAARLRRLDANAAITVVERNKNAALAVSALPYCIGGVVSVGDIAGEKALMDMHAQYGIELRLCCEATAIDRYGKTVAVRDMSTGQTDSLEYDKLIIATGTKPERPDVDGADLAGVLTLKDVSGLSAVITHIDALTVRRAAVVGGGAVGLAIAENLSSRGIKTCVIEQSSHALPSFDADMAQFAKRALEDYSVALVTQAPVLRFESAGEGIRLALEGDKSIFADMVILCVGTQPEVSLAKAAGLGIGVTGGLLVDERQQTTDKDIYAVGDAVETDSFFGGKILLNSAPAAIRQGRVAADNICGVSSRFKQQLGVTAVRVFDMQMASAGLTETELADRQIRYEKIFVNGFSREPYFPGAKPLVLKLVFDKKTGRIYGAQAVGEEGADKRVDVLAAAMRAGLTADKLWDLELTYAPFFGTVKDVVTMAGFVASDVMGGLSDVAHWHDVKSSGDAVLLDVRTCREREAGAIAGSVHIPLDALEDRMGELPQGREIVAYCNRGHRSYTAERMLKNKGYKARNLSGGFALYDIFSRKG